MGKGPGKEIGDRKGDKKGKGKGFQGNCLYCGVWGHALTSVARKTPI